LKNEVQVFMLEFEPLFSSHHPDLDPAPFSSSVLP